MGALPGLADDLPEAVAEEEGQHHHKQSCMVMCKLTNTGG